jgi:large subunit ribosomal protein L17
VHWFICIFLYPGNPYPPLIPNDNQNRNLLHNVLLEEARKEMRQTQYLEAAFDRGTVDKQASSWTAEPAESPKPETTAEESPSDVHEKK